MTSRRAVTAGLVAIPLLGAARAPVWTIPPAAAASPGAARWRLRADGPTLRTGLKISTPAGDRTVADLLAGKPALISIWARWCAPCLAEKPGLEGLAARLRAAGDPIRVMALMAFDRPRSIATAQKAHAKLGLTTLQPLAASAALEAAIRDDLKLGAPGASKISLPRSILLAPDGRLLGSIGAAIVKAPPPGFNPEPGKAADVAAWPEVNAWTEEATFTFLRALGG